MTLTYSHRHDHAAVTFSGELTWDACIDLVDVVDTMIERYFYRQVELVITSHGGLTAALDYLHDAIKRWSSQGVHLRTRVISQAGSAAAVLLSLGHERVAEPGARLFYHLARIRDAGDITAHATTQIQSVLARIDDRLIAFLVDRAMRDPGAVRPHQAHATDREVLTRLLTTISAPGREKRRRSVRDLARVLGRTVQDAVRTGDRDTLTRLYRALAETELAISAKLARTLHLIDRIGPRDARPDGLPGAPGLTVPQWRELYRPSGAVPREVLTRHTLVLGETGSGKTVSAVLPVVAAMADARRHGMAGLIIDPKHELGPVLERLAPGRLHHVSAATVRLNLMTGPRWRLDADLAAGRWLTAAARILSRVLSFQPASPLRVLGPNPSRDAHADFFDRQGVQLLVDVLAFILMTTHPSAPPPCEWLDEDDGAREWVEELRALAQGSERERGPNALALCAWAIDGPLVRAIADERSFPRDSLDPTRWLFARIAHRALSVWGCEPGEGCDLLQRVLGYWLPLADIERQHAGVLATARNAISEIAGPALARTLYFGCEPGTGGERASLDFARLVSREGDKRLVLFQPARDGLDRLVAVALKALFFEAVLNDPDRARGGPDLPLVGYIADEFHRFVTSDPVHGEQSFLDTCRSFGAYCMLATQSVSSLEHALAYGGGGSDGNASAVSILWNNCASKLFFRSTDVRTMQRLDDLCPFQPGLAAVTRVRPVSTLAPGECYAALADGRFERRQIEPFPLDGLAPEKGMSRSLSGPRATPRRLSPAVSDGAECEVR